MKKRNILLSVALAALLVGAGCNHQAASSANTNATNRVVNTNVSTNVVSYTGQDGKNALELLQSTHQVDATAPGYVNAIDSIKAGDHQFWAFYVNGKQAEVGAKDYQTKTGDAIEWKLESY